MADLKLTFGPAEAARLDKLQAATQAPGRAEVVSDALRLLEWYAEHLAKGHKILVAEGAREPYEAKFVFRGLVRLK